MADRIEISSTYQKLFGTAHAWFEGTVANLTAEQANWAPPGLALPAGAQFAHVVTSEDFFINHVVRGGAPLMSTTFAGKSGISKPPASGPGDWSAWAREVQVDLPLIHSYAKAVFASTDEFLGGLTREQLDRELDLSSVNLGVVTLEYLLDNTLANIAAHCGEIACIKGLNGAQGYAF